MKAWTKRSVHVQQGRVYITDLHADMEFDCLRSVLCDEMEPAIDLHCVPRNKHKPTVENMIKTIKERVRCLWHSLPYVTMPKLMVKFMVKLQAKWLNAFPPKGGISAYYSPRVIMGEPPINHDTSL